MAHRTLLSILEDLTDEDLRVFVFLLPEVPNQTCRIPRGKLDNVSRVQVADLLLQYCPAIELEVVARVLHDLPRRDLLKKYNLRAPAETPRMEAAAAAVSGLQEQQLLISERTTEANAWTNNLPETASVSTQNSKCYKQSSQEVSHIQD
ncbi:uncharacterized protein LOC125429607 isoform X3 [Sphaerodactylus townsendi]|uniref:uncharacterized protein LOC125429607 isoform X3 n=1 Tax=Sphaerodactylus townsendi TaxID=933632 RepID=UPI002026F38D|nr:uncharacterized protein LOC125429607 isoform X3 [Sphaerodactylus townsendi]